MWASLSYPSPRVYVHDLRAYYVQAYYGGRDVSHHRNIVWSNGTCMACAWHVHGMCTCMARAWHVHATCCGVCMACAWCVHGVCMVCAQAATLCCVPTVPPRVRQAATPCAHRATPCAAGALDPWSGQGVYPPGGGPGGAMVQNVSADGSQISLVLDLGAHHLDLMFSDARNPPCFAAARAIEEARISRWIQEAYDAHRN